MPAHGQEVVGGTVKGERFMEGKRHCMTLAERYKLEGMLRAKKPVAWIARELGFCRQTIYNEIRKGTYVHTCNYWEELRYSADKGQNIYERSKRKTGRPLKIGHDIAYANFLEDKVLQEHFSPAAALAAARKEGFQTTICVNTLYSYIDKGVFYQLTNKHLWEKPTRKPRKKSKEPKKAHPKLPSIEDRPEKINRRAEQGHWEMDLVVGKAEGSNTVLLTMTERITREEIIIKLPDRRAATIRKALDQLERKTPNFKEKFKSISTDNGPEFLEYDKLIQSVKGGKRFDVWYCHSYAAWEKGTVENHNKMIRRFFPKGTDFKRVTKKEIAALQDWMNDYPRKTLGWKTPREMAV